MREPPLSALLHCDRRTCLPRFPQSGQTFIHCANPPVFRHRFWFAHVKGRADRADRATAASRSCRRIRRVARAGDRHAGCPPPR